MPALKFHHMHRATWLRAAVLGANDGIISTASLVIGVASAHSARIAVLLAGVAGLVAGAMAMATGEYVSVKSQADLEDADLTLERSALEVNPEAERAELAGIYVKRGLNSELAEQVARRLMAHDALAAHARDELGITETLRARPLLAALSSGVSFTAGAALPLTIAATVPERTLLASVAGASLMSLIVLGATASRVGGANMIAGAARVFAWGALAMGLTAWTGWLFGASI